MTWTTIFDQIVENIYNGIYRENTKLPSENQLAEQYGITRHEVRKVYERLTEMGYIVSEQGKGRYFKSKSDKVMFYLNEHGSFTDKMKKVGCKLNTVNINLQEVQDAPRINKKLQLKEENKLYKIQKLRIINDEPGAIHISFVSDKIFENIEEEGPTITSMFSYFKQKGYEKLYHIESNFQLMMPTNFERDILKCPNLVPVMVLETTCCSEENNEPIEFMRSIYRGDRFVFNMDD